MADVTARTSLALRFIATLVTFVGTQACESGYSVYTLGLFELLLTALFVGLGLAYLDYAPSAKVRAVAQFAILAFVGALLFRIVVLRLRFSTPPP